MTYEDYEALGKFDAEQLTQIKAACRDNFSEEQMKLLTDDGPFTAPQMVVIRKAIRSKFSMERVKMLADKRFDQVQMNEIYLGFLHGYSNEEVALYANPSLCEEQMRIIYLAIEYRLDKDKMDFLMTYDNTNKKFAYNHCYMTSIYKALVDKKISFKKVKFAAQLDENYEPVFDLGQMTQIFLGYIAGFNNEQIKYLTKINGKGKPIFNSKTMNLIVLSMKYGLKEKDIDIYVRLDADDEPIFNNEQQKLMDSFIRKADEKQIQQLRESVDSGLSYHQFSFFMHATIPAECMRIYKNMFLIGVSEKDITSLLNIGIVNSSSKYTYETLKFLYQCAAKNKSLFHDLAKEINCNDFSLEEIKYLYYDKLTDIYCDDKFDEKRNLIKQCLEYELPSSQIIFIASLNNHKFAQEVAIAFLNNLTIEDVGDVLRNVYSNMPIETIKGMFNEKIKEKMEGPKELDKDEEFIIETNYNEIRNIEPSF